MAKGDLDHRGSHQLLMSQGLQQFIDRIGREGWRHLHIVLDGKVSKTWSHLCANALTVGKKRKSSPTNSTSLIPVPDAAKRSISPAVWWKGRLQAKIPG